MAALSDFYKLVNTFIPGVPEPTVDYALIRAARRFSSLSWLSRRSIAVTLVADQISYPLSPDDDDNEEVIGVHAVEYNEQPLDPTKPELVETETGTPKCWYVEQSSILVLNPYPNAAVDGELISVRIAVQPTLAATVIADDIVTEYHQAIGDGAIAWLQSMPKQPWSDQKMSMAMERKFLAQAMRAKETALRGYMPWGFMVRRPTFAVR